MFRLSTLFAAVLLALLVSSCQSHAQQPQTPPVDNPPVIAPPVVVKPDSDEPVTPTPDPLTKQFAIVATSRGAVLGDLIARPEVGHLLKLTLEGLPESADPVFWTYSETIPDRDERDNGKWVGLSFPPEVAGKAYLIQAAVNAEAGKAPLVAMRWIIVSGKGPQPPPVVDPVDPDTKPPKPPVVDPATVGPFRALIVRDTNSDGDLTQAQRNAVQSAAVVAYLTAKCVKESDGTPSWRSWDDSFDDDQITDGDWLPLYRQALSERKSSTKPWLCIWRDGKLIHSAELPGTEDDTLTLLKKFGG